VARKVTYLEIVLQEVVKVEEEVSRGVVFWTVTV